ncbi:MAG TPA: hypothetical protein PKD49_13110 [Hyphomicrobium sp.]|nr:hypothetical protein [Hyphomicrobium sp.]
MTALFKVDFEVANNEDFRYAFAICDEHDTPVDLTGATFHMDIETRLGDNVLVLNIENGRIAVDPSIGRIDLSVPAQDMAALPANFHQHDMLMRLHGQTTRLWAGNFSIVQGVTE